MKTKKRTREASFSYTKRRRRVICPGAEFTESSQKSLKKVLTNNIKCDIMYTERKKKEVTTMEKMTFEERKQQRIALQATEEYKDEQRKKSTKASYLHQIELWERQIEHLQNNIERMRQWLDRESS